MIAVGMINNLMNEMHGKIVLGKLTKKLILTNNKMTVFYITTIFIIKF